MRVGVWVLTWQLPSSPEKAPRTPCCLGGHLFCSLASGILETHSLNPVSWLMGQDLLEFTWERKPRPPERHKCLGYRGDGAKPPAWEAGGSGSARWEAALGQRCGQKSLLLSCSWLRRALLGEGRGAGEDHVGGT